MKQFVTILLLAFSVSLFGQTDQKRLVQFSGKTIQAESGEPIQGVRITNLTKGTISFSNPKGIFTIVTSAEDKIQISHLGMAPRYFSIPKDADSKLYKQFNLDIEPSKIKEVIINGLPSLDELSERLMAMNVEDDPARKLAEKHPDMFNILDTIIAHEPSLLSFKNGKVESSPISFFYEKVYKKIKEKMPKPKRKAVLPKFKKSKKKPKSKEED